MEVHLFKAIVMAEMEKPERTVFAIREADKEDCYWLTISIEELADKGWNDLESIVIELDKEAVKSIGNFLLNIESEKL